jgi:N-acetylneuraminic acid mutarotase
MLAVIDNVWTIVPETETSPQARVGATMAGASGDIYLFGGRGGKEMAPLPADIYKFSTTDLTWSKVDVASGTKPEARSFHAMSLSEVCIPAKGHMRVEF